MNLIEKAIAHAGGITTFTRLLNEQLERPVTYQAVRKWVSRGRLPRTDWTGESNYAAAIERVTARVVTRDELLRPHQVKAPCGSHGPRDHGSAVSALPRDSEHGVDE